MTTRQTELPGIGTKHTIELTTGDELVVIDHRSGHWELARVDGDGQTAQLIQLQPREGAELGRILGKTEIPEPDDRRELLLDQFTLEWITVDPEMSLVGLDLQGADIRVRSGASVIAILRGDQSMMNPPPETVFEAGDTLVVMGHREQIERFMTEFCPRPETGAE